MTHGVKRAICLTTAVAGLVVLPGCELLAMLEKLGKNAELVEKLVTAAEGGEVAAEGVKLNIPAGALAADTTITIETLDEDDQPESHRIASGVFDLGPDGTQFQVPVTLAFDFVNSGPQGATPMLAFLENGEWKTLPDSRVEGGQVVATTTHFTPFAVVWEGGVQDGGACEELPFTPCGGDLTGTWQFELGCVEIPGGFEPISGCSGSSASYEVEMTGQITFGADGSYSLARTRTLTAIYMAAKSCLPQGKQCSDAPQLDDRFDKGEDAGDQCKLTEVDTDYDDESGTFTTSGTTLTLSETGDDSPTVLHYCVSGDTAIVHTVNEKDGVGQRFRVRKTQ